MTNDKYILDDEGNPVAEPDLIKWATWFESSRSNRVVERTEVGPYDVSTVFLGLDYNFGDDGPPILWETMTFVREPVTKTLLGKERTFREEAPDDIDGYARYTTRAEAIAGHKAIVDKIKATQNG